MSEANKGLPVERLVGRHFTELKPIGLDAALRAISAGGFIEKLDRCHQFACGASKFTHRLTTVRGAEYRLSEYTARRLLPNDALSGKPAAGETQ